MTPAQRIVFWQASIVLGTALLIPGVVLMVSGGGFVEWALRLASMLIGGFSVVLPSWLYLLATSGEHRSERLLLFAWVKIVGTIALLAIGMIVAPRAQWLLGGLAIAYIGHAVAAYRDR